MRPIRGKCFATGNFQNSQEFAKAGGIGLIKEEQI